MTVDSPIDVTKGDLGFLRIDAVAYSSRSILPYVEKTRFKHCEQLVRTRGVDKISGPYGGEIVVNWSGAVSPTIYPKDSPLIFIEYIGPCIIGNLIAVLTQDKTFILPHHFADWTSVNEPCKKLTSKRT